MNSSDRPPLNSDPTGSQHQLKAVLDTAIAGIIRLRFYPDRSMQYDYISPHCAKIFGCPVADVIADPTLWQRRIHPDDWQCVVRPTLEQVLTERGTATYRMEYRFQQQNGQWIWILANCWVQWQPDQGYWAVTVVDTDISDRKALEAAQQASEAKLNNILNNVSAIITHLWLNPRFEWTIDYVSGRSEEICGYTTAQLMTDQCLWVHCIVPEDWHTLEAEVFANIQAEQSGTYEYRLFHRDGSLRWISQTNHSRWDATRQAWSVSIVSMDITKRRLAELERRNSEQLLQLIMDSVPGCIAYMDASLRYRFVNHTYALWFNRPKDEIIGQTLHTVIGDRAYEQVRGAVLRVLAGEQVSYEAKFPDGTGQTRYVVGVLVPNHTPAGKVDGYYALITDISDRKQAEQELLQAKNAAEAATRAKSSFLATMSHEIRTPMNGVLGMLSLLKNDPLTAQQDLYLNIAQSSAESLLALLNDILDFSKAEADQLSLKFTDFELHQALERIIQTMALTAQAQGLELVLDCHDLPPTQVCGDLDRLRQILINLIHNAIKFTEQGGIVVHCHLVADGGAIALTTRVQDTGMGIPAAAIATLFDPFTQVDPSSTRKHGGVGLGLSICQRLCQLMGGTIQVESEMGRGSCFEFTVRFAPSESPLPTRPVLDLTGIRVLVVDDHPDSGRVLTAYLQQWGATVLTAANGPEAIAHCRAAQAPIQYAFLDLKMPTMDGLELGQTLQAEPSVQGITLILLVDIIEGGNSEFLETLGFQACLSKPVLRSDLYTFFCTYSPHCTPMIAPPPTPAVAIAWSPDMRLLLAEDSAVNQLVFQGLLQTYGATVDLVNNGQKALEQLRATQDHPYTAVFMDCQMPVMDGYEASRRIRIGQGGEVYRDVPIIALTANALAGDREKCLAAGMSDYLSKPVRSSQLIAILNQWLPNQGAEAIASTPIPTDDPDIFNATHLFDLLDGDLAVMVQVYELFLSEARLDLEHLEQAIAKGNHTDAHGKAHSLKGAAANIGCSVLSQTANTVETAIKAANILQAQQEMFPLKIAFQEAETVMRQWLAHQEIP